MLKIKSTFGKTASDSYKPQKCCGTMAKFPLWKSDLSLSLLYFLTCSDLSSPPICILLLSFFFSLFIYLILEFFRALIFVLLQKNVSIVVNREIERDAAYSRFIGLQCAHFLLLSCTKESASYPPPKKKTALWPYHPSKHTTTTAHPGVRTHQSSPCSLALAHV